MLTLNITPQKTLNALAGKILTKTKNNNFKKSPMEKKMSE